MKNRLFRRYSFPTLVLLVGFPLVLVSLLWVSRLNEINVRQFLLTWCLAFFPWHAYIDWRKKGRESFPLFSVISAMFFLYYAVPTYWGDPIVSIDNGPGYEVSSESLTWALLMAVGGVSCLWLGMRTQIGVKHVPDRLSKLTLKTSRMNYVRIVLVVGTLLSSSDQSLYVLGQGGRQAMIILISTIPLLAFAILFRLFLRGEASVLDRVLIAGFLGIRFVSGMSSGWLGAFTSILVICAGLYLAERKRLPRFALVVVFAFTVFFQVGKEDFRRMYWVEREPPAGRIERLEYWVDASLTKWSEVITNPSTEGFQDTISPTVNRLALLNQTGNVLDKTPRVVPYQYGKLYSYMFISLVPRFIWPDKPSINEANQYYQVAYGLTTEENLEGVSIAVGVMTEGYINFGWIGALGVMFLLGIFLDFFQSLFFSKTSGTLWMALGMVLLPGLVAIESQMAQYLGGMIQQVAFTLIVMLPALKLGPKHKRLPSPVQLSYARK